MSLFSPEQLDKIVKETLPADAAPNAKALVLSVDQHGAKVAATFKNTPKGDGFGWELQAAAEHAWDGDDSIGAKVLLRW